MPQSANRDDFRDHLDVDDRCRLLLLMPCPIPRGLLVALFVAVLGIVGGVAGGVAMLVHWLMR